MKFLIEALALASVAAAAPINATIPHWLKTPVGAAPIGYDIYMTDFPKYPGYTGKLHAKGHVDAYFKTTHVSFNFTLSGVDSKCSDPDSNVANSCGIHIHEGHTCDDADKVGGHYYNPDAMTTDPWAKVDYKYDPLTKKASGNIKIEFGYDWDHTVGRAFVLHDHKGARVTCAVMYPRPQVHFTAFNPYPGYSGSIKPKGEIYMAFANKGTQINYHLTDMDLSCEHGPNPNISNSCGMHIHVGKTCADASEVGGHYYDSNVFPEDPWQAAHYKDDKKGKTSGYITIDYGYNMKQTGDRAFVMHDYEGSRISCDIMKMPGPTTVCSNEEYCCPDALHCLTPTHVSCVNDPNACASGQVCCPLTQICVEVGDECTPTPECPNTSYCCPDALHCLTPTMPGYFCDDDTSCKGAGEVCCPLTKECVTVGAACTPPVVPEPVCDTTEYCCPDALHCLTPTHVSCSNDPNVCGKGQTCCPLTEICVDIGVQCTPTPECPNTSYCCPDALHCLTPTNPGTFCADPTECKGTGETCCPLTKLCVTVGDACTPPTDPPAPPPPPPMPVCLDTEYCCPEALHCLTPTLRSCASDPTVCSAGQACCPLTKVCVDVGLPCTPPEICPATSYCCPDAMKCLTPTNPGHFCKSDLECTGFGETCCPLTRECAIVGDLCTPS